MGSVWSRRVPKAKRADKYRLYEQAVQCPESDIDFVQRVFRKRFSRPARLLREDFCGTAALCCEFVGRHPDNRAWGIDLDPKPLAWGRENNLAKLKSEARERVGLHQANVLEYSGTKVDAILAFNFSFCVFKTRPELLHYFQMAYQGLRREGVFFLDLYGGAQAQRTLKETTPKEGFQYIWDQHSFDPIHHHAINYIHFRFRDGSRLTKAFRYDWRLWTIPELRELLREAGFRETEVYWEGTDSKTGQGNGIYRKCECALDDPAWIVYIVSVK